MRSPVTVGTWCRAMWYRLSMSVFVFLFLGVLPSAGVAQILNALYEFQGNSDGGGPNAVIRDSAGNLYGTTVTGGIAVYGTVFKVDPSGKKTTLYEFKGGTDGEQPHGNLVFDANGNLYGTTEYGGNLSVSCGGYQGCGVIFKIDPAGNETTLYSFTGGSDGGEPLAGLARDTAGNLYGTTAGGGLPGCNYFTQGCGVVFKLDPSGKETVLHTFGGGSDGGASNSPVILDPSGNLYGMTTGINANGGTVFKVDPSGNETVLHAFTNSPDGEQPYGTLVLDNKGNLFGTTYGGGIFDPNACNYGGCGVVFKVTPAGKEHVLYSFPGGANGWGPTAGLVRDKSGNLYGTAALGGLSQYCCGVLFELDRKRQQTILHTFSGGADGGSPITDLIQDKAGNFYGSALGGTYGSGVVFQLIPPNFTIAVSPKKASVSPGVSTSSTLTISPVANLVGPIALTCTVPNGYGLSCGISPTSVNLDGTHSALATLSITTSPTTPAGTYKIKSTGSAGTLKHTVTFTLAVS
jgi:uncharacterized repeat protein (TIGR03803 family)